MVQPPAPPPPVVNVVKVQRGCGCLSGCGTAVAFVVLGLWFLGLVDWLNAHEGLVLSVWAAVVVVGGGGYLLVSRLSRRAGSRE